MAKVQAVWIDGSADWNTPLDWNTGVVPDNSNTEVTLPPYPPSPQSATYTVTISAGEEFTVNSVSITDPTATLAVDGSSSTLTSLTVTSTSATAFNNAGTFGLHNYATVTIDGGFTNSGTLDVDSQRLKKAAASLTISDTLDNTGAVQIGNGWYPTAATTVTLGGLTNSASTDSFSLTGSASYAATLAFTGSGTGFTSNGGALS